MGASRTSASSSRRDGLRGGLPDPRRPFKEARLIDFRVLGCHGGELPNHRTTCFLLDGVLALDAGALCEALPLPELLRVEHIVLTHAHFDHTKGIPLLADLLIGRRESPVVVHGSPGCVETLHKHVFNDLLWPDFTRLPSPSRPVLRLAPFRVGHPLALGPYTVHSAFVNHPVEAVGLVIEKGTSALAMSGDTGPTEAFWELVNAQKNLRALFVETSFPDALHELARASGHLTPQLLRAELLAKLRQPGVPIHLYHLKPSHLAALHREIQALQLPGLEFLSLDQRLRL